MRNLCGIECHVCIQWNNSTQILLPALKFKVPPHQTPPHLFWVVPDVTWAESLSERTFHGNEVRVMVCPGAKRSAWNTKRRTPWKPRPDSAEQSLALVHLKTFIKTVCACVRVCVRKICDVSFWVRPHGSHLKLIYTHSRYEVHLCSGIQACPHTRN